LEELAAYLLITNSFLGIPKNLYGAKAIPQETLLLFYISK
jgi:hypothetical protein